MLNTYHSPSDFQVKYDERNSRYIAIPWLSSNRIFKGKEILYRCKDSKNYIFFFNIFSKRAIDNNSCSQIFRIFEKTFNRLLDDYEYFKFYYIINSDHLEIKEIYKYLTN